MKVRPLRMLTLCLMVVFSLVFPVQAQDETVQYEFAESSRSIMRAGQDQTLEMLVQQIYPDYKDLWPRLEQEIRARNPHAFNQYTGRIIPGERVQLVTIKVIRKSRVLNLHVVGTVTKVEGYATATDKSGTDRRLVDNADLYQGDRLTTDKDSTLKVTMIDDAEILLKQDSSLRLTEYNLKSGFEAGSSSILDLIKGGLRKITGSIGANPLSVYRFHTGVMTIGVRGTDYVVKLCAENDCKVASGRNDSDARLHVVVLDGLISLQDEEGTVGELIMGQYAVATSTTKVIVNDDVPVYGLLNSEEQEIYNKAHSSSSSEKKSIWPWILGGALFGL